MVMEKEGEDHLDRSCEKRRSFTQSQGGEEYPTYNNKKRKANWIGHILRRNCLLKYVIEGKLERRIEVTGRRGKRCKDLMDDLEGKRVCWKLEAETLDCALESSLWKRLNTCHKTNLRTNQGHKICCYVLYLHQIHILMKHQCYYTCFHLFIVLLDEGPFEPKHVGEKNMLKQSLRTFTTSEFRLCYVSYCKINEKYQGKY